MADVYDTSLANAAFGNPLTQLFNAKQGDTFFQAKSISNQQSERGFSPDRPPFQGYPEFGVKSPGIVIFPIPESDQHYFVNTSSNTY